MRARQQRCVWASTLSGTKLAKNYSPLIQLGLSPLLRPPKIKVLKWQLPATSNLKLNVDASSGRQTSSAGAILRDHSGHMVGAIAFLLPCLPPLQAELQAVLYSLIYFGRLHQNILVETDCLEVTKLGDSLISRLSEYRRLETFLRTTRSSLHYAPRQVNMVAHHLVQHVCFISKTVTFYFSFTSSICCPWILLYGYYHIYNACSGLSAAHALNFIVVACIHMIQATSVCLSQCDVFNHIIHTTFSPFSCLSYLRAYYDSYIRTFPLHQRVRMQTVWMFCSLPILSKYGQWRYISF